jgi:hypothetical protein
MAGILQTEQPMAEQPMAAQPEMAEQMPEKQVDPKIQEQYDMFVINGMNIIYDEKAAGQIVKRIVGSKDPVKAIADATVALVNRVVDSALENKVQIAKEALVHGSAALLNEIVTLAEAKGLAKLSEDDKAQALNQATSTFLDNAVKTGQITKEELIQMGDEARRTPEGQKVIQAMDKQGPPQQAQQPQQAQRPMPQKPGILAQGGM